MERSGIAACSSTKGGRMNCEKGDLAVIVKSIAGNEGKIATCIRLASYEEVMREGFFAWARLIVWVTDGEFIINNGGTTSLAPDEYLKPLRDNPGTDETLLWAPVPSKLKEKA
jgi:hypothetical protein